MQYGKAPIHIPATGGIKEEFKVLPHSPYSSDLAPSDYHLFKKKKLKKHLRRKRNSDVHEYTDAVQA